jgi:hypothetical protein
MIRLRFLFLSMAILLLISACGSSYSGTPGAKSREEILAALEEPLNEEITIRAHCPAGTTMDHDRKVFRFTANANEWKAVFYMIAGNEEIEQDKSYKITKKDIVTGEVS